MLRLTGNYKTELVHVAGSAAAPRKEREKRTMTRLAFAPAYAAMLPA